MQSTITWPPPYKLKKHMRARHVKLRAVKPHGLEITVPTRFKLSELPLVLEKHKDWIIKHLMALNLQESSGLPEAFTLHALRQEWKISYLKCETRVKVMVRPDNEIVIVGKFDEMLVKAQLLKWIKQKATQCLIIRLRYLSQLLKLPFSDITIRSQKSRWGSCSTDKAINLNYKLIFLPEHLVDHVIVHELCHTKYLNHSSRFWNLVAKYDLRWREHRRELRGADKFIPGWID